MSITELEDAMLRFENQWWRLTGSKETAIRHEFDLTATRYYQLLHALIQRQDAEAAHPIIVHRLRRQMQRQAKGRTLNHHLD